MILNQSLISSEEIGNPDRIIFFASSVQSSDSPLLTFTVEPFSYHRRRLSCLIRLDDAFVIA